MSETIDGALLAQLMEIVSKEAMIEPDKLKPDTLLEELDIQSADYVMILMAVEEKFGVYVSVDSDLSEARTVGEVAQFVARNIKEGADGS